MQLHQTLFRTIFSTKASPCDDKTGPSSQRSSAGHHPSEALPKDLVEVLLPVLKQHSFTQEDWEWCECLISLHYIAWQERLNIAQYDIIDSVIRDIIG